jgi:hypothetical protein
MGMAKTIALGGLLGAVVYVGSKQPQRFARVQAATYVDMLG